jgi:ABC-type glycerol-3-phosphate transport system permease component
MWLSRIGAHTLPPKGSLLTLFMQKDIVAGLTAGGVKA